MRPLLITTEPAGVQRGSGTAVAVTGLVGALASQGIHLSVSRARIHPLGHTVARWRDVRSAALPSREYDVVLGVNGDGRAGAEAARIPFVALPKALYSVVADHEQGLTRALIRRHAAWEGAGCRAARLVLVPSGAAAARVSHDYDVPVSRIEVIGEPFAAAAWRRALPPSAREGRRVLLVAHMYARKRVDDLLRAWPLVLRRHPDALLDVVGDGPTIRGIRRRGSALRGVTVHGHLDGEPLRRLYAAADVAVSTSAHETFGYAVLEALASGLPVVVGAAPAVLELTAEAEARTVSPGDDHGLAVAIIDCLSPSVAATAAVINPAIAARFDPTVVGAAYAAALGRVIG